MDIDNYLSTGEPLAPREVASNGDLVAAAELLADSAEAPATRRARRSDWTHFDRWCADRSLTSLPAEPATLVMFIADMSNAWRATTIQRHLASIAVVHRRSGYSTPTDDPRVRLVHRGVRRTLGVAPDRARPLSIAEVRRIMYNLRTDQVRDRRDAAIILTGFAGGLRRSEIVAIDWAHVDRREEGLVIRIPRSKTDPEGVGREIALPYGHDPITCPVRVLDAWGAASGATVGPVFRRVSRGGTVSDARLTDQSVVSVLRNAARRVGVDDVDHLVGHSLRAGFATAAAAAGASERAISRQTGHRSTAVLRTYIRTATVFADNGVSSLGL